jgi:hypothetical protein
LSGPAALSTIVRSRSLIAGVAALFTVLTLLAPALAVPASPSRAAASSEEIEEKHSPIAAAHTDRRCKSREAAARAARPAPSPDRVRGHLVPTPLRLSRDPAASGQLIPLRC